MLSKIGLVGIAFKFPSVSEHLSQMYSDVQTAAVQHKATGSKLRQ